MKTIIVILSCFLTFVSFAQNETENLYKALTGKTFYQTSLQEMLEKGDTMIFRFADSIHFESGLSNILLNEGQLHNNSWYEIDCSKAPCRFNTVNFYYDEFGQEVEDKETQSWRGIIELIDENSFRVRFHTDHTHDRPLTFTPENHIDIVKFKKKN